MLKPPYHGTDVGVRVACCCAPLHAGLLPFSYIYLPYLCIVLFMLNILNY